MRPKSRLAPVLIVAAVVAALLGYVAAYFACSLDSGDSQGSRFREFRFEWQCFAFSLLARVESVVYPDTLLDVWARDGDPNKGFIVYRNGRMEDDGTGH